MKDTQQHKLGDLLMEWGTETLGVIISITNDSSQERKYYLVEWLSQYPHPMQFHYADDFICNAKKNLEQYLHGTHRW